ncbi:MAG: hypothetical protein OHK0046_32210 [Anaerolineae bacterium]
MYESHIQPQPKIEKELAEQRQAEILREVREDQVAEDIQENAEKYDQDEFTGADEDA